MMSVGGEMIPSEHNIHVDATASSQVYMCMTTFTVAHIVRRSCGIRAVGKGMQHYTVVDWWELCSV